MKKSFLLICLVPVLLAVSCASDCVKVTGPNDIPYTIIADPACFSCGNGNTIGGHLINSAPDFDLLCPGGAVPASWDFVNRTYIVVCSANVSQAYLAGVGTDPADPNQILVTLGLPCSHGMVPAMIELKTFTLELAKTAKTLSVVTKDESR
jgi:hypothetical protein